ncbi:MAG: glycosyltransferase [Acholeplasma sp.]|nr:glycosyltransferase [Acholeplasma sp.]
MKRVLITGANSYIGTSVEKWLLMNPDKYYIETLDMKNENWKDFDFSKFDVVFHVAGIAHVSSKKKLAPLYFKVNRDLAIETALKAKAAKVKQFIFMSSMIIYGKDNRVGNFKHIDTNCYKPVNAYGQSKLEADLEIGKLNDKEFKTVIIRTPVVYGKGARGNFPRLQKLALKLPIIPNIKNQRSMIYIDNLSEFIKQRIDKSDQGVFYPQNSEYMSTYEIMRETRIIANKKVRSTRLFNWLIKILSFVFPTINKVFGNKTYDLELNDSYDFVKYSNSESIKRMKDNKALILVNHDIVIYNFRKELVQRLLNEGYDVVISSPYGKRIDYLINMGSRFIDTSINRHGKNLFKDYKLYKYYRKIMKKEKPNVILTYTIKPNIYGGLAAKKLKIPYIANITGLGTAVENKGILQKITVFLYKKAFKKVNTVFFQNKENQQFFIDKKIAIGKHKLLPGSGVNLEEFKYVEYPHHRDNSVIKFVFVSRIMKEKGIDFYLNSAIKFKKIYKEKVEFHICGFSEEDYKEKLQEMMDDNIIIYHGLVDNIGDILKDMNIIVHPTYYPEGMSNVLLEASAIGRPVITTNRSGTREIVDQGVNGYIVDVKNQVQLDEAIQKFIKLSFEEKEKMGISGRKKVEKEFDRNIVVNEYSNAIRNITHTGGLNL